MRCFLTAMEKPFVLYDTARVPARASVISPGTEMQHRPAGATERRVWQQPQATSGDKH